MGDNLGGVPMPTLRPIVLVAGVALTTLLPACSGVRSGGRGSDPELDRARTEFSRAFASGDPTAFDSLFVDYTALIDMAGVDSEPLRGPSGVTVFAKRVVAHEASEGPEFAPDSVRVSGSRAHERGHWSWSPGQDTMQGGYELDWQKDGEEGWRLAASRFEMP